MEDIDYGPLKELIGTWVGDKGMDIAPLEVGQEENPYYETIVFEAIGEVENADEQELSVLKYSQVVREKSNDEVSHNETGYWMWDKANDTVMCSFSIPRGVNVLAGLENAGTKLPLTVKAEDGGDWGVLQSPFMKQKAKTKSFVRTINIQEGVLHYEQTTMLDIYGRVFEHTEENQLQKTS